MRGYKRCYACLKIIHDEKGEYWNNKLPCPFCGKESESWEIWPFGAPDFLRIAEKQDKYDGDGLRASLIFICTAVEILVDDVISKMLWRRAYYGPHVEIIMDSFTGISRKEGLFRKLRGISLKKIMEANGDINFYNNWQKLIQIRNLLIHGNYWAKTLEDWPVAEVANNCISVFSRVNNNAMEFISHEFM